MATISVQHSHTLGRDEAIKRAEAMLQDFHDRLKVDVSWNGPTASFKGTGFSGTARVTDTQIAFDMDLGLLLRPMKSKIEGRVDKILREKFT